jgi:hypothetical protein
MNQYLSTCCDSLAAEIHHLKTEILRHTNCNCLLIQQYIAGEARRCVNRMAKVCAPIHNANVAASLAQRRHNSLYGDGPRNFENLAWDDFTNIWMNECQSLYRETTITYQDDQVLEVWDAQVLENSNIITRALCKCIHHFSDPVQGNNKKCSE